MKRSTWREKEYERRPTGLNQHTEACDPGCDRIPCFMSLEKCIGRGLGAVVIGWLL